MRLPERNANGAQTTPTRCVPADHVRSKSSHTRLVLHERVLGSASSLRPTHHQPSLPSSLRVVIFPCCAIMAVSTPFQCLTLSLLILPPLFLATYFLAQFPHAPEVSFIHPSLASLPRSSKTWEIYSEDFYDGGAYIKLPFGTVCCPPSTSVSRFTKYAGGTISCVGPLLVDRP